MAIYQYCVHSFAKNDCPCINEKAYNVYIYIYMRVCQACMPSCRECNECRYCSSVHIGKSGPALFSYLLHFVPATKRPWSDWTYCTVHSASFIAIPFTQTKDTYQTEFALARKRPWSDWTYCTVCSVFFLSSLCKWTGKTPTRLKNLAQPV